MTGDKRSGVESGENGASSKGKMSKKAYVFGAGVAGLTAAHELAERGFQVTVIEAEPDPRDRTRPLLGGLAATQWARLPAPTSEGDVAANQAWLREDLRQTMPLEGAQVPGEEQGPNGVMQTRYLEESAFPGGRVVLDPRDESQRRERVKRVAIVLGHYLRLVDGSIEEIWVGATDGPGHSAEDGAFAVARRIGDEIVEALKDELASADFGQKTYLVSSGSWIKVLGTDRDQWLCEVSLDGKARVRVYAAHLGEFQRSRYPLVGSDQAVVVQLSEQMLPGEHGYRFFPSFYVNLYDTLRRIPLMRPRKGAPRSLEGFSDDFPKSSLFFRTVESDSRTVFDNLVSIDRHVFASQSGHAPVELERTQVPSISAVRRLLDASQGLLSLEAGDLVRGQLALLRFLLSSEPRRRLLERTTWNDYADAPGGSDAYREALEKWPQALVGLRGGKADARAFGTAAVQLGLDQVRPGSFRDASLAGPTTSMWFDPWRDYLREFHNVDFRVGGLDGVSLAKDGSLEFNVGVLPKPYEPFDLPDDAYVVLALPLTVMAGLGAGLADSVLSQHSGGSADVNRLLSVRANAGLRRWCSSPFFQLASFHQNYVSVSDGERALLGRVPGKRPVADGLDFDRQHLPAPVDERGDVSKEKSPFRHFAGIQFFLEEDFPGARGHVYYVGSPWGLSSISPVQYRREPLDQGSIWHGMVSVIVGIWDQPGGNDKKPHQCSPQEFAEEVWAQIRKAFQGSPNPAPERPLAYHIDEGLEYSEKKWTNKTPFLTNVVGLADWWPEEPGRYQVYFDRVVFCGTWLRTWTRLVTMEAANESARHAVNAILEDFAVHGQDARTIAGCMVSNPEEHEIEDLGWFKRLDAELCARNLPHLFEILGIDAAVLGKAGDGRGGVIQAITEHVRTSGELGRGVADALTRTLTTLFERYGLG